ncbi:hypothetical protein [Synechocystis sp. PCC 7509]|uniref:hypothetical protein n=1 Tax=Synechocystis sp. PCC 7509 TaxID=927677 RepID=UPI00068789F0|nr:hypothetical protein [Synechocystis sp. PCC 7509]
MSQETSNSPPPKQKPSLLQAQSVKLLRGIIRVSENAIAQIESQQSAGTSGNIALAQQFWSGILAPVRFLLPETLSAKLSDLGLTSIIAGLLAVVIWTTTIFSNSSPQVATIPPEVVPVVTNPEPETTITNPPELIAPIEESKPIEVIPTPEIEVIPTPKVEVTPIPEEVEPTLKKIELTPEQSLIASIQEQIIQQSDSASAHAGLRISNGLIQSVQANFTGGSLVIQVKDDWYSIGQSEQDKLAQKLLDESQQLDFTHLKITDSQGDLLARSPVVGKKYDYI